MTIVGLVVAKQIPPIRPHSLRPTNSTTSDEDGGPTFPNFLKLREMAEESEGKHLTDPTMRGFAAAGTVNVNIDVNEFIDQVAEGIKKAYDWLGDKDKTCWDEDDLLFYEGNYCTQNTVGSIPTWEWNGDYNNGLNIKQLDCFDNDEARSVIILPTFQGRDFIVCDHPTDCFKDDWTYIYVYQMPLGGDKGIKIDTFEASGSNEYVYMHYNRKNGLDGKVSRIGAWKR